MSLFLASWLFILLNLFVFPISVCSSSSIPGLDIFFSQQLLIDRQAANDSFLYLPSTLKNSLSLSLSSSSPLSSILSLQISVPIRVKLIGTFPRESKSLIASFISSALSSDNFQIIGVTPHQLAIKHSFHIDVSDASIADRLAEAIRSEISSSTDGFRYSLQSIPYLVVDQIVQDDFKKENSKEEFYIIYLINLGEQSKRYAYSYAHGDPSPAVSKCLGSLWTGKDRYIWIDLAAGPVDYGPALSGDGVIPRGDFHPLASLHGKLKSEKSLLADLSSLVLSAYHTLLVPSLRVPVLLENSLLVHFVHIHGSNYKDPSGLNWKLIEKTFLDEVRDGGLLFSDQSLRFKTYEVEFSECPICSFAVSRSMNSYTSRFLFDNFTLFVSEYLDSKRMHQVLSDSMDELRKSARIPNEEAGRILPVYVFDLDYDRLLLLDRYHQAIAFRDMVIAVRTQASQTVSDYSCNGRHVITQTRELERPIVGSILQSMWGVSPTHLSWSPRHNNTLVDYTWSVGQTPFGPFSESTSLSFVQRDAAQRNSLLTSLNYTIVSIIDMIETVDTHGGERHLLKQNHRVEYMQRWNLLNYKLGKVVYALSHMDFDSALFFLRSSDHDLYALHSIVYKASQELDASLVCFNDPPFPWASVIMTGMVLLAFFYAYMRRDKLFKNKRKQF